MHAPPKVIFFDAAGTLIFLPRSVGEHYREVALLFGTDLEAMALDGAFRQAWKDSPARPGGDGPRADDDKGWWRELVERVLDAVLSPQERRSFDFEAFFEQVYSHFAKPGVWEVYPEVPEVLSILRERGYRLGVISNFDRRLYAVLGQLRLAPLFERIIISSEIGVDKPDPLIFTKALEALGATSAEAIHVGDDPEKDGGAEAVGLRVFRLERPRHTMRDLLPFLKTRSDA